MRNVFYKKLNWNQLNFISWYGTPAITKIIPLVVTSAVLSRKVNLYLKNIYRFISIQIVLLWF